MRRPPVTTGPANPSPTGFSQIFRGPSAAQAAIGGPLYSPFRLGPRYCGQSPAMAPSAATVVDTTKPATIILRIGRENIDGIMTPLSDRCGRGAYRTG